MSEVEDVGVPEMTLYIGRKGCPALVLPGSYGLASGGSHDSSKPHAPKRGLKASSAMPTFERKSHVPVLRPRAVFACYAFTFILKSEICARPERDGEA